MEQQSQRPLMLRGSLYPSSSMFARSSSYTPQAHPVMQFIDSFPQVSSLPSGAQFPRNATVNEKQKKNSGK